MFANLVNQVKQAIHLGVQVLRKQISSWTRPTNTSLALGSLSDLVRTKPQLIIENALLRQQLIVLKPSCQTASLHRH